MIVDEFFGDEDRPIGIFYILSVYLTSIVGWGMEYHDLSRFWLGMPDGHTLVKRRREEWRDPRFVVGRHVHKIMDIIIWGTIV